MKKLIDEFRHGAETRDADLARDARWQIAWIPYRAGRFGESAQAFAELARHFRDVLERRGCFGFLEGRRLPLTPLFR